MPYIERIAIRNHWRAPDMEIDLRREGKRPRHLILTGPNGSGKTTILEGLVDEVEFALGTLSGSKPEIATGLKAHREEVGEAAARFEAEQMNRLFGDEAGLNPTLSMSPEELDRVRFGRALEGTLAVHPLWDERRGLPSEFQSGRFVAIWRPASRIGQMSPVEQFRKLDLDATRPERQLFADFHQFLVNQHVQRGVMRDIEPETAATIGEQLKRLEKDIATLFERPSLRFELDARQWQVRLAEDGFAPVEFSRLAAGHAMALQILAELSLRIDAGSAALPRDDASLSGVAIIDELALHLHPSLQEKILPFFIQRFPRIQFIIATHSPAIISSIDDALVVDLRPNEDGSPREPVESEQLRGIPYGRLMTTHFGIETDFDLESTELLHELDDLVQRDSLDDAQQARLRELARRLSRTPHPLSREVRLKLLESKLFGEAAR